MAIRTYKVTLDSKNTIAPEPVYLRQGDKTGAVVIDATLMDNGAPISLDGLTPMFKANTADGQAVIADSTGFNIVNASGGEFTYQVPNALAAVPGKIATAYFSLSDKSGTQSTFDVTFIIKKSVGINQNKAEDYITTIGAIGVKGVYNNLQALISAKPAGDIGIYVTTDTGHWFFWNGTAWQDGGQFMAAQFSQDQMDLIKQQTLDFDNQIINSAAINGALGNKPFSAIGNVTLTLVKGSGAQATSNDTRTEKKGITIRVDNGFNIYWFDETLKMSVRNDDNSPQNFIIDYVGVKKDGTRISFCSPLTKFNIQVNSEVNIITTLPSIGLGSVSTVGYNDLDHFEIMMYTEASSCNMEIKKAKIYNPHFLPDIDNEEKPDTDELLDINKPYITGNLSSEKVFVESLNKTCQRFYTSTGSGIWNTVTIPMTTNIMYTQHIQDGKMNRPLKGSVTLKIPTDASAINKYSGAFIVNDTSGKQYRTDIKIANGRFKGNVLKYDFNLPSINNMAPNITLDHLELAIFGFDIANFDITLIDASLKFSAAEATIATLQNADLGTNVMKALNEGDNTLVSTSGAVSCTIDSHFNKKSFNITKDLSSDTGTVSILLPDFDNNYDLWADKQLDLFVTKESVGSVTIPMQITFHLDNGKSVPIDLNPLFVTSGQMHHAQKIEYLKTKTDAVPNYVTLDFTISDKTAWTFFITDISFKSYVADGTQDMNYLSDKSAKLPQLRLFSDLSGLTSKSDKIVVPCSFVNHEQTINCYAKLNWQGYSTIRWPKKSYTIALFADPKATVKLNFKPMPNFYSSNKFSAKADYIDRFHIRNGYGAWLFKEMVQTRKNLPSFFKSMNNFGEIQIMPINILYKSWIYGKYNYGIYTLQTKKSHELYGLDKNNPNDIAIQGIDSTAGSMWKKDSVTFDPNGDVGDFELITDSDKHQNVQAAINRLAAFINSSTDDDFKNKLDQYIDIDSLCDMVISIQLTQNFDSTAGKNIVYVTHDALKWYVQAYDMDSTLGTSWEPGSTQADDSDTLSAAKNKLLTRFLNLFKDAIKTRFNEIDNSGAIAPFRMQEKFKSMVDEIGEYNFEQDNAVWPNPSYDGKDLSYILWLINHRYYFTKEWINNL